MTLFPNKVIFLGTRVSTSFYILGGTIQSVTEDKEPETQFLNKEIQREWGGACPPPWQRHPWMGRQCLWSWVSISIFVHLLLSRCPQRKRAAHKCTVAGIRMNMGVGGSIFKMWHPLYCSVLGQNLCKPVRMKTTLIKHFIKLRWGSQLQAQKPTLDDFN